MKKTMHKLVCLALLGAAAGAQASVIISGTRVVFPSDEREMTVRLTNEGKEPGLIQVWMDDGDPNASPDKISTPFVLTPPMFRMDPAKGQTVRMLYNGTPLPQDRESLFWFNLLEVAPKPNADSGMNYMQMAFRTRIKVFFRPKALNSARQIEDAFERLQWSLKRDADGGYAVRLDNPTPYHINLIGLALAGADGKALYESEDGGMAEPGKGAEFKLKDMKAPPAGKFTVRYTYLNDYGGSVEKQTELPD
ncbi:fimbria/pilus periplasmic chaperone [Herbaspirillum sp.]|uniref:fimbrial biogenesis chaperone n=1 Tax=Herbaspirillum sp. TaxID=1890675 RepID=UPI0031DFC5C2